MSLIVIALLTCSCTGQADESKRTIKDIPLADRRAVLKGYPGDWRPDTDRHQGLPEPPRTKPIATNAVRIALLAPSTDTNVNTIALADALQQRRSHRAFTAETLTSADLGFLLWSSQGVTSKAKTEDDRSFRTAPSAGGRYPLETYVLALRIDGIPIGVHRYLPDTHELVTVRETKNLATELVQACYQQAFVGEAAAVIVWAAVPERTEWKYAYLSPRMIAMEAGHACQNLYLACEAIDAGTCAMLSYDQAQLDALLAIDGTNEFAIYLAVVGKVEK